MPLWSINDISIVVGSHLPRVLETLFFPLEQSVELEGFGNRPPSALITQTPSSTTLKPIFLRSTLLFYVSSSERRLRVDFDTISSRRLGQGLANITMSSHVGTQVATTEQERRYVFPASIENTAFNSPSRSIRLSSRTHLDYSFAASNNSDIALSTACTLH